FILTSCRSTAPAKASRCPYTTLFRSQNVSLIEKLSIERVTSELDKLVKGQAIKKAIQSSHQADLFHYLPIFKEKPQLVKELLKRSEEHTSELQSRFDIVCRLLLEKKK